MEKEEKKVVEKEEVKAVVREDINDMVKSIKIGQIQKRWGPSVACQVKFFNDVVLTIEGRDVSDLYDLLNSYKIIGENDPIISRKLVEEISQKESENADETKEPRPYLSVVIVLKDGQKFNLFFNRRVDKLIIDNFYKLFKQQKSK